MSFINAVGNGLFIQGMFLIPLLSVDRTDIGHGGAVQAGGRSHIEFEVMKVVADCWMREGVEESVVEQLNMSVRRNCY